MKLASRLQLFQLKLTDDVAVCWLMHERVMSYHYVLALLGIATARMVVGPHRINNAV